MIQSLISNLSGTAKRRLQAVRWQGDFTGDSVARLYCLLAPNKQKVNEKEKLIFLRFHQFDAVRNITAHAQNHSSGHNYLVQYSAGSGKSNSIAWFAYRLSGLHDAQDEPIFNSVRVVADRRVLDSQLQNTLLHCRV